jgi:hypothetical protein
VAKPAGAGQKWHGNKVTSFTHSIRYTVPIRAEQRLCWGTV